MISTSPGIELPLLPPYTIPVVECCRNWLPAKATALWVNLRYFIRIDAKNPPQRSMMDFVSLAE